MGSYTNNFKFYKPNPSEAVDVNSQLNKNLDIVDFHAKGLMDYELFNTQVSRIPTDVLSARKPGHKFYKPYSNSIYAEDTNPLLAPIQDASAFVSPWVDVNNANYIKTTSGAWAPYPSQPPAYRVITNQFTTATEIEWTGRLWLGGATLVIQFNYTPVMIIPPEAIPTVAKYFNVPAGNTTTGYSEVRVLINPSGNVDFFKLGQAVPSTSTENYVDLGAVRYNKDVGP